MPFVARCRGCNYLVSANTKAMLKELMNLHNAVSHQYLLDDDDFTVMRINDEQLKVLDNNAHNKAFWEAFNNSRKLP